jgi:hypothetical protein
VRTSVSININGISVAAELSPSDASAGRLHFHAYIHCNKGWLKFTGLESAFLCAGVSPSHVQKLSDMKNMQGTRQRVQEAHYYLQFPKIGRISGISNYEAWKAYVPKMKWILHQYQHEKMTVESYKSETWKLKTGAVGIYRELDFRHGVQQKSRLEELIAITDRSLRAHRRGFVEPPPIVKKFLRQFEPQNHGVLQRTKPLVADGHSRLGKSSFIESLFPPGTVMVLNCQNVTSPPMRRYMQNWEKFQCLIMEEGDWSLVTNNKLLFQGLNKLVDMGHSPTEQHVFSAYVYMKALVINSNNFLLGLPDEHKDYIEKNVLYWKVEDFLYERHASDDDAEDEAAEDQVSQG